ncbi:MAG: tRNA (adenosine(37)-N6)-dimethylallyltransferase MiaA [Chloroflexi bacterium]|nr:tRNA (adenosine(37)-N6)-dimethylallyltransferase MiaA [Chloroflexota bacterium]
MSAPEEKKKVVVIVGPTAVGKSVFAIRLAERINGGIVSADSRLLYRGMDIGTAKPTREEMGRIEHRMIDLADPDENWSLAQYQKKVLEEIDRMKNKDILPIIVGGTGQYIRSLTEGWVIPHQKPEPQLRQAIEGWSIEIGPVELHKKLAIIDPTAALRIDAQNLRRTVRALEVIFCTGKLFSDQVEKEPRDLDFKIIGLIRPREELYQRVDQRIDAMFDQGFVQEVTKLLSFGDPMGMPTLSAIGYKEVIGYLQGTYSLEEVRGIMKRKTRQFIRRQNNWFKPSDPSIEWFAMTPDPLEKIMKSIHDWMKRK